MIFKKLKKNQRKVFLLAIFLAEIVVVVEVDVVIVVSKRYYFLYFV